MSSPSRYAPAYVVPTFIGADAYGRRRQRRPRRSSPNDTRRPNLLRQEAFVGGIWVGSEALIAVRNPATGGTGHVPSLGRAAAEQAVSAAAASFPAWRDRLAAERARVLRRWYDLMLAHDEDLARLMAAEQGKPLAEARAEVGYAANFIGWVAEEARRIYGDVIPGHLPDRRHFVRREPVGVVAAITPWNFPLAMITRKVGTALAARCAIVVKPSELTPVWL
jgi:succinate-semialdehyde dehydrogenase / glutarate-semialdehyde dehydrogenase